MLERGEGKQPGAADVLYLSLQVFHIDVFHRTHPPALASSLARSRTAVMTIIIVITAISLSNIISKNHNYPVRLWKSAGFLAEKRKNPQQIYIYIYKNCCCAFYFK